MYTWCCDLWISKLWSVGSCSHSLGTLAGEDAAGEGGQGGQGPDRPGSGQGQGQGSQGGQGDAEATNADFSAGADGGADASCAVSLDQSRLGCLGGGLQGREGAEGEGVCVGLGLGNAARAA